MKHMTHVVSTHTCCRAFERRKIGDKLSETYRLCTGSMAGQRLKFRRLVVELLSSTIRCHVRSLCPNCAIQLVTFADCCWSPTLRNSYAIGVAQPRVASYETGLIQAYVKLLSMGGVPQFYSIPPIIPGRSYRMVLTLEASCRKWTSAKYVR